MSIDEIEIIADDDGIAVIGDKGTVESVLVSLNLKSKDMVLDTLITGAAMGATAAQVTAEVSANYGRWVKLSEQSAKAFHVADLMKGSSDGLSRAIVMNKGKTAGILEIVTKPGAALANPAFLAGVGGIMAQVAMQQSMDQINDYLAVIDEKIDDLMRANHDEMMAEIDGVAMTIEQAMSIRDGVGHVNDVTWSKVQDSERIIASKQALAIRSLNTIAEKLEKKAKMGDIAKSAVEAEPQVNQWLSVLARCFRLQDGVAVLELDRVLQGSPSDYGRHRIAVKLARQHRIEQITQSTGEILNRIALVGSRANAKVLLHPKSAGVIVHSSNSISAELSEFQIQLGFESSNRELDQKRWLTAVSEARDKVTDAGADGLVAIRQLGDETKNKALGKAEGLATSLAEGIRKRRETGAPQSPRELED